MSTSPAGLFDSTTAVPSLRSRMTGAQAIYFANWTPSDDYLWEQIVAAEAELEMRLRVFLSPVTIIEQDDDDIPSGRYIAEPGYDFHPDMFLGDKWGLIETRHRPIISVTSIRFAYPLIGGGASIFTVPTEWMRVDRQYGYVQIVAASSLQTMPLNTFIMGVLGSGRMIPLMLLIRYTAGLSDVSTTWPQILPLIYRMATYGILRDLMLPGSGSISADGLSQSISYDYKAMGAQIDEQVERLKSALSGPRIIIA